MLRVLTFDYHKNPKVKREWGEFAHAPDLPCVLLLIDRISPAVPIRVINDDDDEILIETHKTDDKSH